MIVSACTRLWCLPVGKKQTSSFTSFLRYYILKNSAIWLADSIENYNFARYEIGCEISTTILVPILDYIQEKLMTKLFLKNPKRTYFGAILGPFYPNLGKNEFSWKKELCQFLDIPIIYHCVKNQKKLFSNFWGKHQTDGQTDRQWWFYKTLCSKFLGIICLVHTQNCSKPNLSPSP